jgi:hypothetical protein
MDKVAEAIKTIRESVCMGDEKGRNIVVLDRGWIFVGDLKRVDGGYLLTNASNIRSWQKGGFGALTNSPDEADAKLDPCKPIWFRERSMLFYVPVGEGWK